jgi:hypothetical protein
MTVLTTNLEPLNSIPGVAWRDDAIHCETPEALQVVFEALKPIGYTLQDCRVPSDDDPFTPDDTAKRPDAWTAQLDVARIKCGSCSQYIERNGISVHGHLCEYCGDVTSKELVHGSRIYFGFTADECKGQRPAIIGFVECWDVQEGWLYLQNNLAPNGLYDTDEDAVAALSSYLETNQEHWEFVSKNGQTLIRVKYYPRSFRNSDSEIYVYQRTGSKQNFTEVLVWKDCEYKTSQRTELPFPAFVVIHESWHYTWPR